MFESLGLQADEEAVYVALIDRPRSDITGLTNAGLGPTRTRAALSALEGKGLVAQLPGRPRRYAAAAPDVGLEVLIRAREDELQQVRARAADLAQRHRAARARTMGPDDVVEVVTTSEATLQRWQEVQRSARREVISFDRPPYLTRGVNRLEQELLAKGISYRCVYDRSALDVPDRMTELLEMARWGEQSRLATGVPVKMFIADRRIGLISLDESATAESAIVIHASSLLETVVALFEQLWRNAVPLTPLLDGPAAVDADGDAELASLLAAGLTDEAIARHRGVNPRTVRRHVRHLMDQLGAQTRFQAGLQASRRGWL